MPRLALEQGKAEPVFQQLDLIADRGLGHAKGFAGPGEIPQPGGGLEHADGVNGREGTSISHKRSLSKTLEIALVKAIVDA
ncbi:hypothetical protein GCM10017621_26520 [Maricaulis virginensis]|uniref:Uncharacterized protein n=1 Tax=Maricaulis virginensis TaxID=144022 RepID=A0A9W6MPP6_9PROT|nr:hypothetical protein GCM10017621_26520 [Maricaulis virginensis]